MGTNLPAKREDVTTTFKEFYMLHLSYVHCHPSYVLEKIKNEIIVWDESAEMKPEHYDKFLR